MSRRKHKLISLREDNLRLEVFGTEWEIYKCDKELHANTERKVCSAVHDSFYEALYYGVSEARKHRKDFGKDYIQTGILFMPQPYPWDKHV